MLKYLIFSIVITLLLSFAACEQKPGATNEPEITEGDQSNNALDDGITEKRRTIVDELVDRPELEKLTTAITQAGIIEMLNTDDNLTLLAPTNEAFEAIDDDVWDSLMEEENRDELIALLKRHIISSEVPSEDINEATTSIDNDNLVETDIEVSNGIIHIIDKVMID